MGIAIAGLASDGRVLAKYLRTACLNHRYVYESPMDTGRLVLQLSDSKD
jgi:20S proteasome subunit alpha 6